ncbi:15774_t:CDS:2, partial [Dentiscutata erythropus]
MLSRKIKLTISYLSILLISCVSGTHYLFSAYSTSIEKRLGFNSVQINIIGSACDYGVYMGKPFLGYLVDNYSARSCGIVSHNNCTTISIPIALLGLSAFLYSQANIYLFEDTFHFLLFIAFSTGLTMLFGSLFLIVVPAPSHVSNAIELGSDDSIPVDSSPSRVLGLTTEQTPLLNKTSTSSISVEVDSEPDISGWQLLQNKDAISLILILVLLAGTGLMYINNVGTIVETLYHASLAHPSHPYSLPTSLNSDIKNLQSFHVSLLSISSCLGRIFIGPLSDITKNYFDLSRICSLIFASILLFCENLLALLWVRDMAKLWIVTACIGLGFGTLYGIAPTTCSEYFGSKRFGFN